MNEAEFNMQSRKRSFSSNKKILENNANNFLTISDFEKKPKLESICDTNNSFTSTYFAPPGECTRSKTVRGSGINPFDLSKPESEEPFIFKLTCSTPLVANASHKPSLKSQVSWMSEYSCDSGFDTESVSESILSFASRSQSNENDKEDFSQESWSTESLDLSQELRRKSSPVKTCTNIGHLLPILKDSSHNNIFIPQISSLTLANLLSGNHSLTNKVSMFDCRFPYEYSGGHVMNSVNVYTCQKLLHILFPVKNQMENRNLEEDIDKMTARPKRKLRKDDTIYIFYCEFSSYRGPKLAQCLRGLDCLANSGGSRNLFFPNIYVLNEGYNHFFSQYPQFCSPSGYVSMKKNHYSLRNVNSPPYTSLKITNQKETKKEHKKYWEDMRESDATLKEIISRRTNDSDILQLFSSHSTVGGL